MPCVSDVLVQIKDGLLKSGSAGQKDGGQIERLARTTYLNEKLASEYKPHALSPILYELSKDRVTPANMWVTFTFLPAN